MLRSSTPLAPSAVVSVAFGALAFVALPFIGGVVAIVAGHLARREIRRSGGSRAGLRLANVGLALGYGHLILGCLVLAVLFGAWALVAGAIGEALRPGR